MRARCSNMRVNRRILFAFLLVAGLLPFLPASAANEDLQQEVDAIFTGVTQPNDPGLAVLVLKNGHTEFEKGYGVAELRTRAKIDGKTNFRLASFTKQFTASAIMLLVHDGKLRYNETLTDVFPDFPAYGKAITIRNLLTHTSGLPEYEDLMDATEKVKGITWTPERQIQDNKVLELLKKEKAGKFPPGTSWAYSNSGYVVLGLIVAKASGTSYGEFLKQRIFAPLKMNHTIVFQEGKNEVVNRAFGHTKENNVFKETDQSPTSATLGDGGIYSNLEDLAKWDEALREFKLLSEKEMQPVFTPVRLNDGSQPSFPKEKDDDPKAAPRPVEYGFGWFLDPYQGHKRSYHDGETMGFRITIQRFAEGQWTIVVLSNRTDLDPVALSLKVADVVLSKKP
jgi:CubicO group peptidase (beta-lactamase class C family)